MLQRFTNRHQVCFGIQSLYRKWITNSLLNTSYNRETLCKHYINTTAAVTPQNTQNILLLSSYNISPILHII